MLASLRFHSRQTSQPMLRNRCCYSASPLISRWKRVSPPGPPLERGNAWGLYGWTEFTSSPLVISRKMMNRFQKHRGKGRESFHQGPSADQNQSTQKIATKNEQLRLKHKGAHRYQTQSPNFHYNPQGVLAKGITMNTVSSRKASAEWRRSRGQTGINRSFLLIICISLFSK